MRKLKKGFQWGYPLIPQEESDKISLAINEAKREMHPGESKLVSLPDGHKPVTVRMATPAELKRLKETSARAPGAEFLKFR